MSAIDARLTFWERHERRFLTGLPYPCLLLTAIADPLTSGGFHTGVFVRLGIDAALLALLLVLDHRWDRSEASSLEPSSIPQRVAIPAFLALVGCSLTLVIGNPEYGFYAWTGYLWSWRLLRGRSRLAGVALMALPVAISQTGAGPYTSAGSVLALAGVFLVNALIAGGMGWFGWVGSELQNRRSRELQELHEANVRLEQLQQQLVEQAAASAVADERRRMAREIHDTLAQGLMGILTQLQAADAGHDEHVRRAIELARDSLTEARRSVNALAPAPLAGARLPEAIRGVADRWSQFNDVSVELTTTGEPRALAPDVEVALLRAAQEALANVAKHAAARRVGITLSYMDDLVTLDVRDDGVGFDLAECRRNGNGNGNGNGSGGFGLLAMRERIEGVSGTLAVESELHCGTAISASVPA